MVFGGAQQLQSLNNFAPIHSHAFRQPVEPHLAGKCIRSIGRKGQQVTQAAIKKKGEKHVVCSKTLIAKAEQADAVKAKCRDILDFSIGRKSVKSNGILEYTCSQDIYEPNVFHFWERYDGNVSMGRHNTSKEVTTFMEGVQDLLEGPIGLALYSWKDGQISHSCVQGGPKGEGGLDDATGASKSAGGGASMRQTSAVVDLGDVKRGDEGDAFGMGFRFPWQKEKKEK